MIKATEALKTKIKTDLGKGMTQSAAAEKHGVSQSLVSRLFGATGSRGRRKRPVTGDEEE
jgi:hypothetical protein